MLFFSEQIRTSIPRPWLARIGYIDSQSDYPPDMNKLSKNQLTLSEFRQRTLVSYKLGSIVLKLKSILIKLRLQIFGTLTRPDSVLDREKRRPLLLNFLAPLQGLEVLPLENH